MTAAIAALVFVGVVVLVVGVWWAGEARRRMRARLGAASTAPVEGALLKPEGESGLAQLAGVGASDRLTRLLEQAGRRESAADLLLVMALAGLAGGLVGWLRVGSTLWVILLAAAGATVPLLYLVYQRNRRIQQFEHQFPDALDTMARAIRAGNAMSGSIQLVAEESPDPVGGEFTRVFEEIRLGLDPGEALFRLESRIPTEDVRFFCTAVRIQRGSGGNLAEILDRLSEVIRERYKLLSHARVLSSQHRWTAICVGLSPLVFAAAFQLMHPGYFDTLLTSSIAPMLIGAGVVLEILGFVTVWRIAQIEV